MAYPRASLACVIGAAVGMRIGAALARGIVGTHGYLDDGALPSGLTDIWTTGLRARDSRISGLDWGGCVALGEPAGVGREVAVRLSRNAWTGLALETVS